MKASEKALKIIKEFEGCRLTAYKCPANILTIGYGHTGEDVVPGLSINQEYADLLLVKDVDVFEKGVTEILKVPVTQNQFDALVSFAFNLGLGALRKSTLMLLINKNRKDEAALEFVKWNKAAGKELPGLTKRRKAEQDLFLTR